MPNSDVQLRRAAVLNRGMACLLAPCFQLPLSHPLLTRPARMPPDTPFLASPHAVQS